ncbi:hypothetical protein KTR10_01855 [Candidatus Kaiserbacteria bacterium]|nr:hypothetical protein [Candidatus Kaiserbacteria bacterium]
MVRRVLNAVYKEVRGLHQAAYVLASFAVGSQLLALIRDRLLAHQFGAGGELDLYYAAFRLPDILYVLFASTLSVYVLIPFVAKAKEEGRRIMSEVFTFFCIAYAILAVVLGIFAPQLVAILFPGFADSETLVLLIRILLLQPFFLGLSSLFGVITQMGHRFVLYALSPLIYNIGIIIGVLFFYPIYGLQGLVFGVVLGALGHAAIQLPFVFQSDIRPRLVGTSENIGKVLRVSVPRALTLALHQFVLLGLVGFASVMTEGSVAVLQFGFNLQSIPLAIIGVSYSVAAFPMLAGLYADGKMDAFRTHIMTALRHIIFWSVPILALVVVIRAQLVRVILGSGAFSWEDTRLTAAVLALFVFSLLAQAIHLLVVRAFYAIGNTKIPFLVTLGSSLLAVVFAYIGIETFPVFQEGIEALFRVEGVSGTEVLMLPLAYSLALILHAVTLLLFAVRRIEISGRIIFAQVSRAVLAAILAGLSAYATLNVVVHVFDQNTLMGVFLQGFVAGVVGIVGGVMGYALQKSPELDEVVRALHSRVFTSKVAESADVAPRD